MKTRGKPVDISSINVAELQKWLKAEPERNIALKCQALIALAKGVSVKSVCIVLDISRESLSQWRKLVSNEGIIGFRQKSGRGRKSGLTKQIEEDLKVQLLKTPSELGYKQAIWNGKLVCKYLADKHSKIIAVRTAQDWLKKIGLTRQRPRYHFNKADPELNEKFKTEVKKNRRTKR